MLYMDIALAILAVLALRELAFIVLFRGLDAPPKEKQVRRFR